MGARLAHDRRQTPQGYLQALVRVRIFAGDAGQERGKFCSLMLEVRLMQQARKLLIHIWRR